MENLSRTVLRQIAVQHIYAFFLGGKIDRLWESCDVDPSDDDRDGIKKIIVFVEKNVEKVEKELSPFTARKNLGDVSALVRAILFVAFYEVEEKGLPFQVVVNEAIENAKKFGEESDGGFVNAVLDKWEKSKK